MRPSHYFLLLLLLLSSPVILRVSAHDDLQPKSYDNAALTAKCQHSQYPGLCLEGARFAAGLTGPKTIDDKTMGKLMLSSVIAGTMAMNNLAESLTKDTTLLPDAAKAVKDCAENRFNNALADLTKAEEAVKKDDGKAAVDFVLAAMSEYSHCSNIDDDPENNDPVTPLQQPVSLLNKKAGIAVTFLRNGYAVSG